MHVDLKLIWNSLEVVIELGKGHSGHKTNEETDLLARKGILNIFLAQNPSRVSQNMYKAINVNQIPRMV